MISVVIPALNEEKYIGRLLDSLLCQTHRAFEVVVVDGNSGDNTREIVKSYKSKMKNLKLVVSDKKSVGSDRNAGASHASYSRILFLDADCCLQKDFLEKTLKEIEERKLELTTCYVEPMCPFLIDKVGFAFLNFYMAVTSYFKPQTPGYCIFTTKKLHEKIGGFDPSIKVAEDWDYSQRAKKYVKFGVLNSIKVLYCMRRFEEEGRLKLYFKYLLMGFYRFFIGEIRTEKFNYKLGEHN